MSTSLQVRIDERSGAVDARRVAAAVGAGAHLGEVEAGRLAIVATEAATNLERHAQVEPHLLVRPLRRGALSGVELLSLDGGPGIANPAEALRDGYSSGATPGTGLGAMSRLSSVFDVWSRPGTGTALVAQLWPGDGRSAPPGSLELGGVSTPLAGQHACGDGFACRETAEGHLILVVDGLGHGPDAAEAASAAIAAFEVARSPAPAALLHDLHAALRPTRGAAAAVVQLRRSGEVVFAGVGNVAASILGRTGRRSLASTAGILGHRVRRIQELRYERNPGELVVMHTDGVSERWTLDDYPGLAARHPSLVAGVLWRDFRRPSDDATVVVAREAGS